MVDNLTQNGLSNGPINQGDQSPTVYSVSTGSRPSATIPERAKQLQTLSVLHYPSDMPKFYMGFTIYRYTRESLMSIGGITDPLYSIALPLPEKMIDVNQVTYNNKDMGSATVGNILNNSIGKLQGIDSFQKAADLVPTKIPSLDELKETAKQNSNIGVGAGIDLVGTTGPTGMNAAKAVTGWSPNYFLTVLLDGPAYKEHDFSWTFSPRSADEMRDLTQILRIFRNAMAPGLKFDGAVFTFPRVFRMYYQPSPMHLYQFKPAVLKAFSVDYSAGGVPAMRQEQDATAGRAAPAMIRVSARFTELEFWLRSDFGDDKTGNDENADLAIPPVNQAGRTAP